ncbi:MAG TPA: ParA family protein [Caldilineaceae bacterium]|nr:ParA family protein [Caldilineaceae bacterium]
MSRICAVVSQKGGVGKTSLVQNLGAELAGSNGQRVLCVDFDPQSNLTIGWGLDPVDGRPTVYEAMLNPETVQRCIVERRPNLDLLPANLDLAGAERQFAADFDRNSKLKEALQPVAGLYEFILIDVPPTLGFFAANALVAATEALVPLQLQVYAFRMLDPMLELIGQAKKANPGLKLAAIIPTMYDGRTSLSQPVLEAAREKFGALVTQTIIPVNVRIADAPLHGIPVQEHDPRSSGALAYHSLAKELLSRG